MHCQTIEKYLSAYLDGELDEETQYQVALHLAQCPRCRTKADSLKAMCGRLNEMPAVGAPPDFAARLHDRLAKASWWKSFIRRIFKPYRVKIPLELAAAAALGTLVLFVVLPVFENHHMLGPDQLLSGAKPAVDQEIPKERRSLGHMEAKKTVSGRKKESAAIQPDAGQVFQLAWVAKEKPAAFYFGARDMAESSAECDEAFPEVPKSKPEIMAEKALGEAGKGLARRDAFTAPQTAAAPNHKEQSLKRIKAVIKTINGRIISIGKSPSGRPESVRVEMEAASYNAFIDFLNRNGEFKTPPPDLAGKSCQSIELIITLNPS